MPSKPNILIVGPPGSGKTCSFEKEFTGPRAANNAFLDFESKGMPFIFTEEHQKKLGYYAEIGLGDYFKLDEHLTKIGNDPKIKVVFFDTLGFAMRVCREHFRKTKTGWDVWTAYNQKLLNIVTFFKEKNKVLIATIHSEVIQMDAPDGGKVSQVRAFVQGKEFEGKLEGEFLISIFSEPYKDGQVWKRRFRTNTNGLDQSKSPMWLGLPEYMPNDISIILDKFYEKGIIV